MFCRPSVVDTDSLQSVAAMLPVAVLKAINPHVAGFRMFHLVSHFPFSQPTYAI